VSDAILLSACKQIFYYTIAVSDRLRFETGKIFMHTRQFKFLNIVYGTQKGDLSLIFQTLEIFS